MPTDLAATREVLLKRRGLVFVERGVADVSGNQMRAIEIELAELGFALSHRLRARLESLSVNHLTELQRWMWEVLAAKLGANRKHRPLFRKFPTGIPDDTFDLWFRKVLCHFLQTTDQACLFCHKTGTTHVLSPCHHVVCDNCFDGENYSACPVCEHHVDTTSPFFKPSSSEQTKLPNERVRFQLLDLGESVEAEARALFVSFCERKQAMSPQDKTDFITLTREYGERVLPWLPETIPLKENVATVFGTLFEIGEPDPVLHSAKKHLKTATDVLRLIATFSGADPALQRETIYKAVKRSEPVSPVWTNLAKVFGASPPQWMTVSVPIRVRRFKVARLGRPVRRALLALMEAMAPDLLAEDMLRHRSYWVWVGEFLHPHEYRKRYPKVARAFAIVRQKGPHGEPPPEFQTFYSRLEAAARRKDAGTMTELLMQRPGELARRFDHALRIAGDDARATERLVKAFASSAGAFSTPVLLTLLQLLPTRARKAKVRIYWPKGALAKGVSSPDERPVLPLRAIEPAVRAVEAELLERFVTKPAFRDFAIDDALRDIIMPFNERTASPSAVVLPRGSRIRIPAGKVARLFLHWCQPEKDGDRTDLDLSVAFYDDEWSYVGVCSYYELKFRNPAGRVIAQSAGDLRDAPFPDGATEFVDLHINPRSNMVFGTRSWSSMLMPECLSVCWNGLSPG